jgi:hypothetical protein
MAPTTIMFCPSSWGQETTASEKIYLSSFKLFSQVFWTPQHKSNRSTPGPFGTTYVDEGGDPPAQPSLEVTMADKLLCLLIHLFFMLKAFMCTQRKGLFWGVRWEEDVFTLLRSYHLFLPIVTYDFVCVCVWERVVLETEIRASHTLGMILNLKHILPHSLFIQTFLEHLVHMTYQSSQLICNHSPIVQIFDSCWLNAPMNLVLPVGTIFCGPTDAENQL